MAYIMTSRTSVCAKKDGHYYNNWAIGDNTHAASMYLDDGRKTPRKDKIYVCGTNLYVWSDEEGNLVVYGATAQDGVQGTSKNYVYSSPSDKTRTVLSGKLWIYQHGDYNQFLRFKHWGAANDTAETDYSQVQLPNAWTGAQGCSAMTYTAGLTDSNCASRTLPPQRLRL